MGKFIYVIIAFVLVCGGYYFLSSRNIDIFSIITSKNGGTTAKNNIAPAGEKSQSPISDFLAQSQKTLQDLAGQATDGAKNVLNQAPDIAMNKFSDVVGEIKNTTQQGVISALGGAASSSGNQAANAQFKVCSVQKKSDTVSYIIENPSFPNYGLRYSVQWGDGTGTTGDLKNSAQNFLASHLYANNGIYHAVFQITVTSGTLVTEREVCIQ